MSSAYRLIDRPEMDHGLLSPSGRVSKRARAAFLKREHDRLFPPGYWDEPEPTPEEKQAAKKQSLLDHAARLRDLAARGMSRRAFTKEADALEAEASKL